MGIICCCLQERNADTLTYFTRLMNNEEVPRGLKDMERARKLVDKLHYEITFKDVPALEREWCQGHPWNFDISIYHRLNLSMLWMHRFSSAQKKEILRVSPDEIEYFYVHNYANCFLKGTYLRMVLEHVFPGGWITSKGEQGSKHFLKELTALELPHPKDDEDFFLSVRDLFLQYLLAGPHEHEIYYNDATQFPSAHLTSETDEKEKATRRISNTSSDSSSELYKHGEKLVMYAVLRLMEQKLVAVGKRYCSGCTNQKECKACSGCKVAFYCSAECQKRDWREHKKICKIIAEDIKAKAAEQNALEEEKACTDSIN